MKVNFLLKGSKAYEWNYQENICFLGYFFDQENQFYQGKDAVRYISENLENQNLSQFCSRLNGLFTFIIRSERECMIVSDSVNYFPLFYTFKKGELIISDYWKDIIENTQQFYLNNDAVDEFLTAGFVLSDQTLDENIFKTNANKILTLTIETAEKGVKQYKNFMTDSFSDLSFDQLSLEAEQVLLQAGKRLITFLNNRTAVVPLSGGYDSRLIVSLLKKMNYEKVVCFTYGKINPEVSISKKVAEQLNYEWHFFDYTKINIDQYRKEPQYTDYLDDMANGFSMPYLMEYFAVKEMMNNEIIPGDSVFLPGHSGDFLGGSYIKKTVKNDLSFQLLPAFLESKYFIFSKKKNPQRKQITERIKQSLERIGNVPNHGKFNMSVEEWDIQEKLSKFIFHSSQVFNFLGFQHYFVLWDKAMVDFYRNVPYRFRENKKLYDDVAEKKFFAPQKISFLDQELKASKMEVEFQKVKESIRYFFPWKIVLKRINHADWPYYEKLTDEMLDFIENTNHRKFVHFKTYNAVICAWYIQHLKKLDKGNSH